MKTIYTVTIKTEPMFRLQADFGQATNPIEWQETSNSFWSPTPYRVADAFHDPAQAATLLLGFLEMRPTEDNDYDDEDVGVYVWEDTERCYHGEFLTEDCPYCAEETGMTLPMLRGERLVYAH